jgi:hypothetical protein
VPASMSLSAAGGIARTRVCVVRASLSGRACYVDEAVCVRCLDKTTEGEHMGCEGCCSTAPLLCARRNARGGHSPSRA